MFQTEDVYFNEIYILYRYHFCKMSPFFIKSGMFDLTLV
jgi:hypothetical protein